MCKPARARGWNLICQKNSQIANIVNAQTNSIPPKIVSGAPLTFFATTVLGAAILGVMVILFFFNPSTSNFYPVCQFHLLTGWNCPGCGATRAFYALLHGNLAVAFRDNALFVLSLSILLIWFARLGIKKIRGEEIHFDLPPKILWTFLVVAIVFSILRNLPALAFLSP